MKSLKRIKYPIPSPTEVLCSWKLFFVFLLDQVFGGVSDKLENKYFFSFLKEGRQVGEERCRSVGRVGSGSMIWLYFVKYEMQSSPQSEEYEYLRRDRYM